VVSDHRRPKWTPPEESPDLSPLRHTAEQVVKILLNNPCAANSAQYERIMEEIRLYTQTIKEQN
jgi:hypothetical protein